MPNQAGPGFTPEWSILNSAFNTPLLVQRVSGADDDGGAALIEWYRENREFAEAKLLAHGAILFRAFGINSPAAFQRFVRRVSPKLLDYIDGNSPRRKLTQGVYTSTEYPPEYFISLHNELSYSYKWPSRLFFCCLIEPERGGETPIADCRRILTMLRHEVVDEFTRKKVKYTRNLHGGAGVGSSWQDTFETKDKRQVEGFCREAGIEFFWRADGGLRLIQIGPGVTAHPKTGELVWFNQATQFHPSTHPKHVYESVLALYKDSDENLPQDACFGDDSPIDSSVLEHIRETTFQAAVVFPWQCGDLLVIDNVLMSHGRMPFSGPRRVLAAMS